MIRESSAQELNQGLAQTITTSYTETTKWKMEIIFRSSFDYYLSYLRAHNSSKFFKVLLVEVWVVAITSQDVFVDTVNVKSKTI